MKIAVCDICGSKQSEKRLYRYKRVSWFRWKLKTSSDPSDGVFDICHGCLKAITKARQEGGVSDETCKG